MATFLLIPGVTAKQEEKQEPSVPVKGFISRDNLDTGNANKIT